MFSDISKLMLFFLKTGFNLMLTFFEGLRGKKLGTSLISFCFVQFKIFLHSEAGF